MERKKGILALQSLIPYLNKKFLYHLMWQVKATDLKKNNELFNELDKKYNEMLELAKSIIKAEYLYQAFYIQRYENNFIICHDTGEIGVSTGKYEKKNLLDAFPKIIEDKDTIFFQIVTIGKKAVDKATELKNNGYYSEYFYWHGFCATLTETLADYVNNIIKIELKKYFFNDVVDTKRFSFGYQALPNLSEQEKIVQLLKSDLIGVEMIEQSMLYPEYTTCALVLPYVCK